MPKTKELRQHPSEHDWTTKPCQTCGYGKTIHEMLQAWGAERLRDRHGIEGVCKEYRP